MVEPPQDQPRHVDAPFGIGPEALGQVAHEPEAPAAAVLPSERVHVAPVLVEGDKPGLVDQRVAGSDNAIEDVEIASAWDIGAGVECLVESPEGVEHARAERHVRARAEVARPAWIQRVAGKHRPKPYPFEPALKSATLLEHDLRLSLEFERQY